jgi:hypothetical protein
VAEEAELFSGEEGAARLEHLRLRVVEHNISVVSGYYTQLKTARLAALLSLKQEEVGRPALPLSLAGCGCMCWPQSVGMQCLIQPPLPSITWVSCLSRGLLAAVVRLLGEFRQHHPVTRVTKYCRVVTLLEMRPILSHSVICTAFNRMAPGVAAADTRTPASTRGWCCMLLLV